MTDWAGDERELVRRCREGSDAAYAMLVREHRPRLYALAYRLTVDRLTAEDVVQEAFLAAFKAGKLDLLFVFNMLLTGFDARRLIAAVFHFQICRTGIGGCFVDVARLFKIIRGSP